MIPSGRSEKRGAVAHGCSLNQALASAWLGWQYRLYTSKDAPLAHLEAEAHMAQWLLAVQAQRHGDCVGVDLVVVGLAAMDGLHREGMTEDKRDTVFSTEVSKPVPRKHTFGSQDDLSAVGGDGLQKRLRGGLHVPVQQCFTGLVEDAHVHGAGLEVDAAGKGVLFGVESLRGLLLVRYESFGRSQHTTVLRWGGASISINPMELTALGMRSAP